MATKTIAIDTESGHGTCADAVREAAAVWGKSEGSKAEAEKFESVVRGQPQVDEMGHREAVTGVQRQIRLP